MAEVRKGITVTHTIGGGLKRTRYPGATKIRVSNDGHLAIDQGTVATLAMYAPGHWLKAELDGQSDE